jgi:hypothetical protein
VDEVRNFPTMIIPNGTEIAVNEQGQLSIRTPGNLVIQNSGVYSVIESGAGSVRIDPKVKVEAVSVQAADSCFVAGELTAWRVRARTITLEKGARANIMLQESESLEIDRSARLVGNFASEKELYLMLGRFSRQLRELPDNLHRGEREEQARLSSAGAAGDTLPQSKVGSEDLQRREEVLSLVRMIVQRELGRADLSETGRTALEKVLDLVRAGDVAGLQGDLDFQLSRVEHPSVDLDKARQMLQSIQG